MFHDDRRDRRPGGNPARRCATEATARSAFTRVRQAPAAVRAFIAIATLS
jgi:hypothetical protein